MKRLLQTTLDGAVQGARSAFYRDVVDRWSHLFVRLDHHVSCRRPLPGTKWLHRHLPKVLFLESFTRQMSLASWRDGRRSTGKWSPKPAYGFVGHDETGSKFQCIDDRMGAPAGVVNLPRMVRTPIGRTMLQHEWILLQEALARAAAAAVGDDDFMVAGAD